MDICMVCAFMFKICMKAQKHAHFLHLVPPFAPHYIIMVKGLLQHTLYLEVTHYSFDYIHLCVCLSA